MSNANGFDMDIAKYDGQEYDVQSASEESIVQLYSACESQSVARKVAHNLLIKSCLDAREFHNQQHAWELLNNSSLGGGRKLRIPRPLRYLRHKGSGYLVMEYLDGVTMEEGLCQENILDVANAIWHIHDVSSRSDRARPGPLDQGHASGFPWGEWHCEATFNDMEDLQQCVDKRLRRHATYTCTPFQDLPLCNRKLVFCHMDIALRNILLMPNDDIAFLDWEYASYYPAEFEMASLSYWTDYCSDSKRSLMRSLAETVSNRSIHKLDCDKLRVVQAQSIQCSVSEVISYYTESARDFN